MFAKTAVISIALIATVVPTMSAPVAPAAVEARELEARLSLPAGVLGDLVKSLGKGLLSGGAVTGLLDLLGEGGSNSTSTRRDLESRAGLAGILEKLVGVGGKDLESVIKDAILGGAASGVAVEGVNAVANSTRRSVGTAVVDDAAAAAEKAAGTGLSGILEKLVGVGEQDIESVIKNAVLGGAASGVAVEGVNAIANATRRSVATTVVDDAAKVAEKGIGSVLGNGAADGLGSALGGLGIGAIISKLFGGSSTTTAAAAAASPASKRALADLSDAEVNTLLEYINTLNTAKSGAVSSRAISSSVGKGIAGLVASLAATQGVESAINEVEKLLKREPSFDEL
ncbi:hypothetical protein B0H11DRAFT_1955184, partial [Mycena galericulata]